MFDKIIDAYEYLVQKILNFIIKYSDEDINDIKMEQIRYGLEIQIMNVAKLILILVISLIFGVFPYVLTAFITQGIFKSFAGGLHLKHPITCLIFTFVLLFFPPLIAVQFEFNIIYCIVTFVISLILTIKFAPSDTESKPIISKKFRKKLKIKTIIVMIVLYGVAIIMHTNYSNIIITMMLLSNFLITPLAYKIFNRRYNNHESYKV